MKKTLFVFLFLLNLLNPLTAYELSICAIFHNEERFLKDWIDFHLVMGVEHFYLYDNNSEDQYLAVLAPYIESGKVDLIEWDYKHDNVVDWNAVQCNAYNHCLNNAKSKWVAFLDTDEYLYSPKSIKLTTFLKEFRRFGAVSANWVMYGTSNIFEIDIKQTMIKQLVFRENAGNIHVKTIVQTKCASHFINPHYAILKLNYIQVTENKETISGPFSNYYSGNKLRINHYWTRDQKFFLEEKMKRHKAWWNNEYIEIDHLSSVLDDDIYKVFQKLKKSTFSHQRSANTRSE